LKITPLMRNFYQESQIAARTDAGKQPPLPFAPGDAEAFVTWMNGPAVPGCPNFTRFLQFIYASRLDVQRAFPCPTSRNAGAFNDWVFNHGQQEHDIPTELMPARTITKADPVEQAAVPGQPVPAVDVVGYFQAELGLGETARLLISGIEAADIPYTSITSREIISRQEDPFQHTGSGDSGARIKILCINCDHMRAFMQRVEPGFLEGRYVIGLWFWELEYFPQSMIASFDFVDEIWTGSAFAAEAFRKVSSKPVFVFPHPFLKPAATPSHSKAELGLPDRYMFYFAFDFFSTIERKNPLGLIAAFKKAFAPGEGPMLVIKTINGGKRLAAFEKLQYAAAGHDDILVMDQYLSPGHRDSMMANCDCYVSLHRSEGLGMTMAEAMLHGKPVIATRYSGNLDFMTEENSYLVSHRSRPVGKGSEPYPPEGVWADPDIEEAASLMRHVYENPGEAAERAQRARLDIESKLSPEVCGRFVTERIADINATRFSTSASAKKPKATMGSKKKLQSQQPPAGLQTPAKDTPHGLRTYWRAWMKL
jgi:glycosyltransferase involved in cell wall biosynthesis